MSTEFKREARYAVFKFKDVDRLSSKEQQQVLGLLARAGQIMDEAKLPMRKCLVIESDWPEYEPAWATIEARITGKPTEQHQGEPKCKACGDLGVIEDKEMDQLPNGHYAELGLVACRQCEDQRDDQPCDLATWKRRAIEAESKLRTYDPQVVELGERGMQALLADPKPSELVLTKCKLCDQLQADLTERDELIDQLRNGYVFETGPYQVEMSEDQWHAALGVFENYNMGDDKHLVFLEEQGRGLISEILIEIGVARAPDTDEVVE